MNAFVIDAFEFCRLKERLEGDVAVADLPRLAKESVDQAGALHWSLRGGSTRQGHPQMILSVDGKARLVCQRCLAPFDFAIVSESTLVLAPDEDSADEIDEQVGDDSVEVIVGSHSFDVMQLIEDEALLMIPLSPKHETCPDQLVSGVAKGEAEKESPFAVLKNLKQSQ